MLTPEQIRKMLEEMDLAGEANKLLIRDFDTTSQQDAPPEMEEQVFIDIVANTEPVKLNEGDTDGKLG